MTACWSRRMPGGEGVQVGVVVGFDGGEPVFEVAAGPGGAVIISAKAGDVPGQGASRCGQRARDGRRAGPARPGSRWAGRVSSQRVIWRVFGTAGAGAGRGECLAEWPDVAADGLLAAGPAAVRYAGWRWLIKREGGPTYAIEATVIAFVVVLLLPHLHWISINRWVLIPLSLSILLSCWALSVVSYALYYAESDLATPAWNFPGAGPGHMPTTCTSPSLSPPHSGQRTSASRHQRCGAWSTSTPS